MKLVSKINRLLLIFVLLFSFTFFACNDDNPNVKDDQPQEEEKGNEEESKEENNKENENGSNQGSTGWLPAIWESKLLNFYLRVFVFLVIKIKMCYHK